MYVLHTRPDTAGLVVRIVLEELGQPYRETPVDIETGTPDSPAYRHMQPQGLVPALETPDGPMFETGAILLWLADRHGAMAPAPDHPDRAAFLKWFVFTNNALHTTLLQLFYPLRYTGDESSNPAFLRTVAGRMVAQLGLLDGMAAEMPGWCSPAVPSVLTCYIAMLLRWIASFPPGHPGLVDLAAYPALMDLARAVEVRPAALAAARAENLGATIFSAPQY